MGQPKFQKKLCKGWRSWDCLVSRFHKSMVRFASCEKIQLLSNLLTKDMAVNSFRTTTKFSGLCRASLQDQYWNIMVSLMQSKSPKLFMPLCCTCRWFGAQCYKVCQNCRDYCPWWLHCCNPRCASSYWTQGQELFFIFLTQMNNCTFVKFYPGIT